MSAGNVTVIGAGIVGVCSAVHLARAGFRVTLVDSGPVGEGASFGNSGNISPGAVVPYLIPGVLKEVPKWLLDKEGPLCVRPGVFFKVLPWMIAAAKSSKTEGALRTSRAMRTLHGGTFEAYDELIRGTEAEGLIVRSGQLYVSERENGAQGTELTRFMREAAGVRTQILDHFELRELEPTLSPSFKSGLLILDNGRCRDPHRLVRSIADEAVKLGATITRGKVTGFQTNGKAVTGVVIDGTAQPTERVVIAAGAASGRLTEQLGSQLPVEAERGYHATIADPGVCPRIPVSNVDRKFVCAPMDMGLRLAGTAEFAGLDAPPSWHRAKLLEEQARRMFPGINTARVSHWTGNRPSLPDGLPVLGVSSKMENAWFAFGNSHFGMSAGPVMGKVVGELVSGRQPHIDITPFAPTRFN